MNNWFLSAISMLLKILQTSIISFLNHPFLPSLENSLLVVPHADIILYPCCPSVNNYHSTYMLSKRRGPKLYEVSRYAVDLFGAVMLTILFPVPFLVPL